MTLVSGVELLVLDRSRQLVEDLGFLELTLLVIIISTY